MLTFMIRTQLTTVSKGYQDVLSEDAPTNIVQKHHPEPVYCFLDVLRKLHSIRSRFPTLVCDKDLPDGFRHGLNLCVGVMVYSLLAID
jgi:hypothetical protein